jgi:hypothetical protein
MSLLKRFNHMIYDFFEQVAIAFCSTLEDL